MKSFYCSRQPNYVFSLQIEPVPLLQHGDGCRANSKGAEHDDRSSFLTIRDLVLAAAIAAWLGERLKELWIHW
jgi:hypothetical protein